MKPFVPDLPARISARDTVTFNENTIVRLGADGRSESIAWIDLHEVAIVTSPQGPLSDDLCWVLSGSAGSCAVSGSASGSRELLARLQELPGFDNEAVITAMASRGDGRFICWQHPGQ